MGPDPFIGVIYHWIGGLASATYFIPFRAIKRWSWEIYWLIQSLAAWLVAPLFLAIILVPNLFSILHDAPPSSIFNTLLIGALCGIGAFTFGLAIRYLGIALGYAISLSLYILFANLIAPIYNHATSGHVILTGVFLTLIAVALLATAAHAKDREVTFEQKAEAGESDYSFPKGLTAAIITGITVSFFPLALKAGAPIRAIAHTTLLSHHHASLWQNLPTLLLILWGAFLTNLICSTVLIFKNGSIGQLTGQPGHNPMRATHASGHTLVDYDPIDPSTHDRVAPRTILSNYFFAKLAGAIGCLSFFFFAIAHARMGTYAPTSWSLHLTSTILFATLWGLLFKEWRATTHRTRVLIATGLILLITSTIILGYGNSLNSVPQIY